MWKASIESPVKNIGKIFVGIAIPIVVLFIANHRFFIIFKNFLLFQFEKTSIFLICIICIILTLFLFYLKIRNNILILIIKEVFSYNSRPSSWAITCIVYIMVISLVPYYFIQYRIYSETNFQILTIGMLEKGDTRNARLLCERYLSLYPQRRSGGSIPDPICVPLLLTFKKFEIIDDYLKSVSISSISKRELNTFIDWNAKKYGRVLTDRLSGRSELKNDNFNQPIAFLPPPNYLFEWSNFKDINKTIEKFDFLHNTIEYKQNLSNKTRTEGKKYLLQVGAFLNRENADNFLYKLKTTGFLRAVIDFNELDGKTFSCVVIPIDSVEEENSVIERLKNMGIANIIKKEIVR